MALIFAEKEAVWLVGGTGDGSAATALAGGCTKTFFDANTVSGLFNPSLICGANGAPIDIGAGAAISTDVLGTKLTDMGAFVNTVEGIISYVNFDATAQGDGYVDGRYEILETDGSDYIVIDDTFKATTGVATDVNIGGAFDDIDAAETNIFATSFSQYIYTNLNETYASGFTWTSTGDIDRNTKIYVRGYNTLAGDMAVGQAFYQTAGDAFRNGIDSTKSVKWDGANTLTSGLVNINGKDNIIFEHIHFADVDSGSGGRVFVFSGTPESITISDCFLSGASRFITTNPGNSIHLLNSFLEHDGDSGGFAWWVDGEANVVDRCVFDVADGSVGTRITTNGENGRISNNLFYNDGASVQPAIQPTDIEIFNNTIYGFKQGVLGTGSGGVAKIQRVFNNIIVMQDADDGSAIENSAVGGSTFNDYNCYWSIANSPPTEAELFESSFANSTAPELGPNELVEDPQFADVANRDFTVLNPNVLQGGQPDISGNNSQMGAAQVPVVNNNEQYEGNINDQYGQANKQYGP